MDNYNAEMKIAREKIDETDSELFILLVRRMLCSEEVARIKSAHNMPIYDAEREKQILERIKEKDEEFGGYIAKIYECIMTVSKERQSELMGKNNA